MVSFTITLLAAFALSPLLEYVWHAWVAHGRALRDPSADAHIEHHRTPYLRTDVPLEMRTNALRVGARVVAVFAVLALLVNPFVGAGSALGLLLGYVFSTVYHAQMHQRGPRTRYERWMWRFHFHHHFQNASKNFGLTNPVFDFLFGTAVVPDEVVVPDRLKPVWLTVQTPGFRVVTKDASSV